MQNKVNLRAQRWIVRVRSKPEPELLRTYDYGNTQKDERNVSVSTTGHHRILNNGTIVHGIDIQTVEF